MSEDNLCPVCDEPYKINVALHEDGKMSRVDFMDVCLHHEGKVEFYIHGGPIVVNDPPEMESDESPSAAEIVAELEDTNA